MQYNYSEALREGLSNQLQIEIINDKYVFENTIINVCSNKKENNLPYKGSVYYLENSITNKMKAVNESYSKKDSCVLLCTHEYNNNKLAASVTDNVYFADFNKDLIELSFGRNVFINENDVNSLTVLVNYLKRINTPLYNASLETQDEITAQEYRYHFRLNKESVDVPISTHVNDLEIDKYVICQNNLDGCCFPSSNEEGNYTYLYVDKNFKVICVLGTAPLPRSFQKPRKLFAASNSTIAFLKKFVPQKKQIAFNNFELMLSKCPTPIVSPTKKEVEKVKQKITVSSKSRRGIDKILAYFNYNETISKDNLKKAKAAVKAATNSEDIEAALEAEADVKADTKAALKAAEAGLYYIMDLQSGEKDLYKQVNEMMMLLDKDWIDKTPDDLKEIFSLCTDKQFEKIEQYF